MSPQHRQHRSGPRQLSAAACGLIAALACALPAAGQTFPSAPPTVVFGDDFETTTPPRPPDDPLDGSGQIWDEWVLPGSAWTDFDYWPTAVPAQVRGGLWGSRCIWEGLASQGWHGLLLAKPSQPGDPGYLATDWTNFRIDVDLTVTRTGVPGIAWGLQDPDGDSIPDGGYLFTLEGFPTLFQAQWRGQRTSWTLRRIDGEGSSTVVDQGTVELPSADDYTRYLIHYRGFRLRLEWYCGNLRVRIQRIYNPHGTSPTFYGCGASCPSGSPEDCWCTLAEWSDGSGESSPGTVALYHTGLQGGSGGNMTLFDNFVASAWDPTCGSGCTPWSAWATTSTELIEFKYLYEGALLDYAAGRNVDAQKIDVATTAPAVTSSHNTRGTNYCNGWNLLVDLPPPTLETDAEDVKAYLQSMSSAVDYVSSGGGSFVWLDDFDSDPESATFNPVPMVADGATPINNSLLDAYDWYVDQVTTGDWADDPLKECRKWYVVLITDGAESCAGSGEFACDPGQAAAKFANPDVPGVEPLPVFTIGFSESVADAPSQLTCISDSTGGLYYGARNASELSDALYQVFYSLQTDARSFIPLKVSPPPSSAGAGTAAVQDSLAVFPVFQAAPEKSIWNGNLYGFRLNLSQTTLPSTADCEVDFSQVVVEEVSGNTWDARARLAEQLAAHDESSPTRYVFMGSKLSGSWVRHDLATVPSDDPLRGELQGLLDVTGGITDLKTQEVVNFVRGVWMDDDPSATPDPQASPRPAGTSALGDIYHSQPVVVGPPNRSMFFFDFGFAASDEKGAHDYPDFMRKHAKRRRVVLAGANDGMLHAFDGGVWDRARGVTGETYDLQHDLGDGSELFAYVPQAVMPRLYAMTYGKEQQYLVDGPIEVGDAFIDHDGDSQREWRTVALATMRRGGRGLVALDITQPDPIDADNVPAVSDLPGCIDGSASGCDGEYPQLLWEFADASDEDGNCPAPLTGDECEPFWDLGWTWSKPAIARIAVYNPSSESEPDDVFVAFFGGGWDASKSDRTGTFFYGVDVATGQVIVKYNIGVALPGSPTALDSDLDGFHDRIYFADSDGGLWRISYPEPDDPDASGAEAGEAGDGLPGVFQRIWDFRGLADRQQFFTRPVTVPAMLDGAHYIWGLALGSGNRAWLGEKDQAVNHFFFVLDPGDGVSRDQGSLTQVRYDQLDGSFACDSALDPPDSYGWYLTLRPNEKVMYDAAVVDGHVLFPTFDPTPGLVAERIAPDQCGSGDGGDGDGGDGGDGDGDPEVVCKASGIGRRYDLWFECGLGDYSESNTPYSGIEAYNIGSTTYVGFSKMDDSSGENEEFEHLGSHIVTNWRQY